MEFILILTFITNNNYSSTSAATIDSIRMNSAAACNVAGKAWITKVNQTPTDYKVTGKPIYGNRGKASYICVHDK